MFKVILNYVLILSLITNPLAVHAAVPLPNDHPNLEETKATIEAILRLVDRSQFSLEDLVEKLDYEPDKIVAFVKAGIRFEQYPGLLRGPTATLVGRSGNSLDQAILLAKLLKDSGYDARIVRSEISSPDALLLLKTMERGDTTASVPIGDIEEIKHLLNRPRYAQSEFFQAIGLILDRLSGHSLQSADYVVDGVTDAEIALAKLNEPLNALNIPPGASITQQLIAEARQYFWVEYRAGPGVAWEGVHPALPDAIQLNDSFEAKEYYANEIPQELSHRVSVQVFLERNWAGKAEAIPVTGRWEAPTANLADLVVSYTNSPSGVADESVETREEIEDAITRSTFFVPTLNGTLAPQARGFDLAGNDFPADMMDLSKIGLFQTMSTKGSEAGAAISSLGQGEMTSPQTFQSITRQWVEFRIVAPDGSGRTIHRDLFNSVAHDTPEKRAAALTRTMSLTVPVGNPSRAQIVYGLLDNLLMVMEAISQRDCSKPTRDCGSNTLDVDPQTLLLARVFDELSSQAAMSLDSEGVIYRAEPGLTVRYTHRLLPLLEHYAADIVHNKRRSLGFEGSQIVSLNSKALKFGIVESVLEGRLIGLGSETTAASLLIGSQGQNWNVIQSTDQLDKLSFRDAEIAYMKRDLAAGYSLIVDQGNIDPKGPNGWWRIDVETGETLGILSDGTGGAHALVLAGAEVTSDLVLRKTGTALVKVVQIKGARAMACILAGVTIAIILGIVIGSVLVTISPALTVIAAYQAIGRPDMIPVAAAMATQWGQAVQNWYQLIGYLTELCVLRV